MPTPGQPEVFLSQSPTLFGEDGNISQESTVEFLRDYILRFARLIEGQNSVR